MCLLTQSQALSLLNHHDAEQYIHTKLLCKFTAHGVMNVMSRNDKDHYV